MKSFQKDHCVDIKTEQYLEILRRLENCSLSGLTIKEIKHCYIIKHHMFLFIKLPKILQIFHVWQMKCTKLTFGSRI